MDEALVEAILGIVAALATLAAAWLQRNKRVAYEQGDEIMAQAEELLRIGDALATAMPQLSGPVDRLKALLGCMRDGWNDARYSTEDMRALRAEMDGLIREISAFVPAN